MQIVNTKTGVAYNARTTKSSKGFVSIVSKYEPNPEREFLVSREIHLTRAKAYRYATTVCKTLAKNHAWMN